jgi:hypothetical protein
MSTPELARPDLTLSTGAAAMTILLTGADPGIEPIWIALPGSGDLEVIYEYQDQPAATAILWHQGGNYVPLVAGDQVYNSFPGDALYFAMAYQGQSIKVGWAYV